MWTVNPAVVSIDDAGSPIGVVAVGLRPTTDPSAVRGNLVPLFNATLAVRSNAPAGLHAGAIRLTVDEMINQGSLPWVSGVAGVLVGYPSGHSAATTADVGAIVVRRAMPVGLFAWVDHAVIANIAPLTGGRRMQRVHAFRLVDHPNGVDGVGDGDGADGVGGVDGEWISPAELSCASASPALELLPHPEGRLAYAVTALPVRSSSSSSSSSNSSLALSAVVGDATAQGNQSSDGASARNATVVARNATFASCEIHVSGAQTVGDEHAVVAVHDAGVLYASCAHARDSGGASSGVYRIAGPTASYTAACEQRLAGGGWMVLVSQASATAAYDGTTVPFIRAVGNATTVFAADDATTGTSAGTAGSGAADGAGGADGAGSEWAYSRDWSASGVGLQPNPGDEFLIHRRSDGDYVRMVLTTWCGWASTAAASSCGGRYGHPGFGAGPVYDAAGGLMRTQAYFNGCALTGGCGTSGSDAVAFSAMDGFAHGLYWCYGGCWAGGTSTFHWGANTPIADRLEVLYRAAAAEPPPAPVRAAIELSLKVYHPSTIEVRARDAILNRISTSVDGCANNGEPLSEGGAEEGGGDGGAEGGVEGSGAVEGVSGGQPPSSTSSSGAPSPPLAPLPPHSFQRTEMSAIADGVDVTPIVTFVSAHTTVVSMHSRTAIRGLRVGTATITLERCPDWEFDDAPVGGCPAGWGCSGAAMVSAPRSGTDNDLQIGGDGAPAVAASNTFALPAGAVAMRYRHSGGADAPSGAAVYDASSHALLCSASRSDNTWDMVSAASMVDCPFGAALGLRSVYVVLSNPSVGTGSGHTLVVDSFRFVNAEGSLIELSPSACSLPPDVAPGTAASDAWPSPLALSEVPATAQQQQQQQQAAAVVHVVDEPVVVRHLIARVISSAEWLHAPPTALWDAPFAASFLLHHTFQVRRHHGAELWSLLGPWRDRGAAVA